MHLLYKPLIFLLLVFFASACIHPQVKFRKSGLLDPMMDPAKTGGIHGGLSTEPYIWSEKGSTAAGSSTGASCPTCGG